MMTVRRSTLFILVSMLLMMACRSPRNVQKHSFSANRHIGVSPDDFVYFSFSDGSPYIPVGINMINWSGRYSNKPDSAFYEFEQWMKNLSENGGNYVLKGKNTTLLWLGDKMNNWESEFEKGIAPQILHGININLKELGITSPVVKIDIYMIRGRIYGQLRKKTVQPLLL